jgi:SAM-dependent methyltransferase
MNNPHANPNPPIPRRGPVDGAYQVLRVNLPKYMIGLSIVICAVIFAFNPALPNLLKLVLLLGASLAAWWLAMSVIASFWVYDLRQALDCWWTVPHVPTGLTRYINIHSGLDQTSVPLHFLFPSAQGLTLDIYDHNLMPEPSITLARKLYPPLYPQIQARYDALPVDTSSVDAVFLVFAAHELRTDAQREALLKEAWRTLGNGGRLFLAEHPRDLATFACFGPGVFHFFSHKTWEQNLANAGFKSGRQFSLTPFASVWVCEKTFSSSSPSPSVRGPG